MLSQRLANMVFAVCLVVICGYFASLAWKFEAAGLLGTSGMPPSFFPLLTLALIAGGAVGVFYIYWRHGQSGGDFGRSVYSDAGEARRGLLMVALAVTSYIVWTNVGFIPMAALMSVGALLAMGVRSPFIYAVVVGLAVCIYFLFTRLLGAQLG